MSEAIGRMLAEARARLVEGRCPECRFPLRAGIQKHTRGCSAYRRHSLRGVVDDGTENFPIYGARRYALGRGGIHRV